MRIEVTDNETFDKYETDFSGRGVPEGKISLSHDDVVCLMVNGGTAKIKYSAYISRGFGCVLREALEPHDKNNLYNFLKAHDVEPEKYGIEQPENQIQLEKCSEDRARLEKMGKSELAEYALRLEKQIDSGYC